jgi:hypothetical protein
MHRRLAIVATSTVLLMASPVSARAPERLTAEKCIATIERMDWLEARIGALPEGSDLRRVLQDRLDQARLDREAAEKCAELLFKEWPDPVQPVVIADGGRI